MVNLGSYRHNARCYIRQGPYSYEWTCKCTGCTFTPKEKAVFAAQEYSEKLAEKSAEASAQVFQSIIDDADLRRAVDVVQAETRLRQQEWDAGMQRAQRAIELMKELPPCDIDFIQNMDSVTFAQGVTMPSGQFVTSAVWEALKLQVKPPGQNERCSEYVDWTIVSREEAMQEEMEELERRTKARNEEEKRLVREEEARAILKAGQPPAWDPLGVAPFAWHLPAPRPLPSPPVTRTQQVKIFLAPLSFKAYLCASLSLLYFSLVILDGITGTLFSTVLNLVVCLIWVMSTVLTIKRDRLRHEIKKIEARRGELS